MVRVVGEKKSKVRRIGSVNILNRVLRAGLTEKVTPGLSFGAWRLTTGLTMAPFHVPWGQPLHFQCLPRASKIRSSPRLFSPRLVFKRQNCSNFSTFPSQSYVNRL